MCSFHTVAKYVFMNMIPRVDNFISELLWAGQDKIVMPGDSQWK